MHVIGIFNATHYFSINAYPYSSMRIISMLTIADDTVMVPTPF